MTEDAVSKAVLSSAVRENIPDSGFACPEKRLYPHHHADGSLDLIHLRAALSRIGDPNNDQCGKAHLLAHREAAGIGEAKALLPVKAQLMDTDELTAWFEGRIARRLLAIPFGGPFVKADAPLGVDLDGEWFDEDTDIYGTYPELRRTRERLVDWHHSAKPTARAGDPSGMMTGHVLGKSILDPDPDEDGWWVDMWLDAGNKRLALVKRILERGGQLFGSSQAGKGVEVEDTGRIAVWPYILQTLTTSPQNQFSAFAAKAALDDPSVDINLRRVLSDLSDLAVDLTPTSGAGEETAKSGRVDIARFGRALDDSLEAFKPQP